MKELKEKKAEESLWNKVEKDKEIIELKDGKGKVKKIFYIIYGYKNVKFGWEKKEYLKEIITKMVMEIDLREIMTVMVLGIDLERYIKKDNEIKAVMRFIAGLMFEKYNIKL